MSKHVTPPRTAAPVLLSATPTSHGLRIMWRNRARTGALYDAIYIMSVDRDGGVHEIARLGYAEINARMHTIPTVDPQVVRIVLQASGRAGVSVLSNELSIRPPAPRWAMSDATKEDR